MINLLFGCRRRRITRAIMPVHNAGSTWFDLRCLFDRPAVPLINDLATMSGNADSKAYGAIQSAEDISSRLFSLRSVTFRDTDTS
jgi:hypothetical protein